MRHIALLLFTVTVAHASVTVTRTSDKAMHPMEMEIEVQLPYSNKKARVPLTRTDAFENVPITIMENGISRTFSAHQVHHPGHSHYRDIESKSVISVRHVNGRRRFSGHVMHEGTSYFLEPKGNAEHRVTRYEMKSDSIEEQIDRKRLLRLQSRRKRQAPNATTTNVIEVMLLLDHTVWNAIRTAFGGDDTNTTTELNYYYTHILNGVDVVYRNIGSPSISIKCIGMVIAKTQADQPWMPPAGTPNPTEAQPILDAIKAYSVSEVGTAADHVMAFTRTDIKSGSNKGVTGLAFTPGVCTESRQSISEDRGLHSWATAAHELAHNLGAEHDGYGGRCSKKSKYVMGAARDHYTMSDISYSYQFSSCSIDYMKNYINSLGRDSCLRSYQGVAYANVTSSVVPGSRLTLDRVCKLIYPRSLGKHYTTDSVLANPAGICAQIYCYQSAQSRRAVSDAGIRAPVGTPCGNKKSCNWSGHCASDDAAPVADESCFWGDYGKAEVCARWASDIRYALDNDYAEDAKDYCNEVGIYCCKTLKTLCW